MFQDSPMTPAEEAANEAFEAFADEQRALARLSIDRHADRQDLRLQLWRTIEAEKRFKVAHLAIGAAPTDLEAERNDLVIEGGVIGAVLLAFVGLIAPALVPATLDSLIVIIVAGALGVVTGPFIGRLAAHIGRRM